MLTAFLLGVAGVAPLRAVSWLQLVLGLVGGVVLVFIGVRTLWSAWRVRLGGESTDEVGSRRRAFLTAVAATASNPLTISWAAIFAAASTAGATRTPTGALALLCGVALGSASWFAVLSGAVALAGQRLRGAWLVAIDVVSGFGLVAFGGALGVRTVQDV